MKVSGRICTGVGADFILAGDSVTGEVCVPVLRGESACVSSTFFGNRILRMGGVSRLCTFSSFLRRSTSFFNGDSAIGCSKRFMLLACCENGDDSKQGASSEKDEGLLVGLASCKVSGEDFEEIVVAGRVASSKLLWPVLLSCCILLSVRAVSV